jgi:hypothetical protein
MYSGRTHGADGSGESSGGERRTVSRNTVTAAAWLLVALSCIALATLEHERAKAGGTGSILCGTLMSCGESMHTSLSEECADGPNAGNLPPCGGSAAPEEDDANDIFSFGGEARDSMVPKSELGRYDDRNTLK